MTTLRGMPPRSKAPFLARLGSGARARICMVVVVMLHPLPHCSSCCLRAACCVLRAGEGPGRAASNTVLCADRGPRTVNPSLRPSSVRRLID
ncbi:hypothetical protein K458DRAFT_97311 [Lentithecium fluviatile CBS 122367]|uniref:Uncharacterized protein n=1 Tax=Lentithecium fluviatile CBS 122367 TaxID=1168545 RepID=A0A6G1JII8_9PLEO|nr:hypothetical protein K458DRAFT_97311 [Lentithecium fluviatile CBS 122367]